MARQRAFAIVAAMERSMSDRPRGTAAQPLTAWWLGRTAYRDAWDLQHRLVEARVAGLIGDQLLLLEHQPVLTLGRHSDPSHVIASPAELAASHIELIQTERGGEVTYHGPGQLTAYVIVKLADRGLLIRPLVRALEAGLVGACASLGVEAAPRAGYPGCWCGDGTRKIGAVGVRIEHGVSYHGIALNVTVALADFELIDACGIPGVESTSIARELGQASEPTTESVARAAAAFAVALAGALEAPLAGVLPPLADPRAARAGLEALLDAAAPAATATATAGARR
jgi:lipoyl(octanoyl) transferase